MIGSCFAERVASIFAASRLRSSAELFLCSLIREILVCERIGSKYRGRFRSFTSFCVLWIYASVVFAIFTTVDCFSSVRFRMSRLALDHRCARDL